MAPTIIPLAEIPTLSLLYKLQHLVPAEAHASSGPRRPSTELNTLVSLIRKDITTLQVSAIVNAANNSLLGGGGVDGAIHRAAGYELVEECQKLRGCATGSAKITSAYELPCDKVIHAVGPIYWEAKAVRPGLEKQLLRSCYRKSLELAAENGCRSIAFSALSTGVYGYPSGEAAKEAIGEVRAWIDENWTPGNILDRIVFVCFEMKDVKAYEKWLPYERPVHEPELLQRKAPKLMGPNSVYFPPAEGDLPHVKEDAKREELVKEMPDPPTAEPTQAGEPQTKKQKADHDRTDDEWEAVERPKGYAENGDSEEVETKGSAKSGLHAAAGTLVPDNQLAKDW
jgi:O-acetyl-ADP-ribose deacetylase (regulator of RNase III)